MNLNFSPWIGVYTPGTGLGFDPTVRAVYAVPTRLVFVTEPAYASTAPGDAGTAFSTQPVLEAEDASGNLGINFDSAATGAEVSLALNAGSGSGILDGTATVAAAGGYATFSGLGISQPGVYTLTASALGSAWSGLAGATSSPAITINFSTPVVGSISPQVIPVGASSPVTLSVFGSGLYPANRWSTGIGTPLSTTFVSSTELTAVIPTADLGTSGSDQISVTNPSAGSSNSLTLEVLQPVTSVYVDAAWAGDAPYQAVTWSGGSTHYIGYDAFATIQAGVDAAPAGQTVYVAAGTYTQAVGINQGLTLSGAGAASTTIEAPAGLSSGAVISVAGGVSTSISGLTVVGGSGLTGIADNGGTLSATGIAVSGNATGIAVENQSAATITNCAINGGGTGILVGSSPSDTSTLTVHNSNLSSNTQGINNRETGVVVNATSDWWGSNTGPATSANPGGTGSSVSANVAFSPWLGDANLSPVDYLVFSTTTSDQYVVSPNGGNTGLSVTLGGNTVGSIAGGVTLGFAGNGGTVTIDGESGTGSSDVFTILNASVQFNAADGLSGSTINFLGNGIARNVDAQGTTNTFNIQGTGASGPSGSLVGDSGSNAFVFGATGNLLGSIQGGGVSTLNYSAYSSGVSVNLGNGSNGTGTGVGGTVAGITAVIGGNSNDTLNAGSAPNVALTGGLGTNTLSGTGAGDSVVESLSSSYTLTSTKLTGASPSFTDKLSGINVATLTGSGATSNSFTVTGWAGSGSLSAPAGTGTVTDSAAGSFTLTNSQLTAPNTTMGLNGIATANLTDSSTSGSGDTFTVTGWTGLGSLTGPKADPDAVVDAANGSFTLSNTSLKVGATSLTWNSGGITTAKLTDTNSAGGDTFNLAGWTGAGSLTGPSAADPDIVAASESANYVLTNSSLAIGTEVIGLSNIATANLTAKTSGDTFTVTGWTGGGSLAGTSSATMTDTAAGDFALSNAQLTAPNTALSLSHVTIANLTDTSTGGGDTFTVSGWTGTGSLTGPASPATPDTVTDAANGSFTLTNSALTAGTTSLTLKNIGTADLADTGSGHTFTVGGWTGSGSLAGSSDTVTATKGAGFTLSPTLLSSTDGMALGLGGITTADLTDTGGGHTFTVSGWTGVGTLTGPASPATPDTVTDSANGSFTLTNAALKVGTTSLNLKDIATADLTDTGGGHTFTISGWTGAGSLTDSSATADVVSSSASASYTLTNSALTVGTESIGLSNITTADLTDTGGDNSFSVSGWTGSGTLTDGSSKADTVVASKGAGFTLTNTSLSSTDGMNLSLSKVGVANLTDTVGGHTFTVTGWTGIGSLTGPSDTVAATESVNTTLTNAALIAGSTSLTLSSGVTAANLTLTSTTHANDFLDASAFSQGPTQLTATGNVNAILYGGTHGGDTLTAAGTGNDVLIGNGARDTLTDNGTGRNILIGGGAGGDTLTGNGNDILVSGTTTYDSNTSANVAALDAILAEWTSSASYANRITAIMNGVGTGHVDALNASTITQDGSANTLQDETGQTQNQNWFLSWPADTVTKKSNETDTNL